MSLIARLGVILGLNSSEFTSGLDQATKKTREFEMNQKRALKNAQKAQDEFMMMAGSGLMKVAAAAIAVGAAFKYADDIEDTAKAFDVTTASLLAMKAAFQAAGGESDMVSGALQKLAVNQQAAIESSDELRQAFTKLKISGKDVENLELGELFKRVTLELSKVENTTERVALQTQILGKAVKGTNWKDFVDNYKEFADPDLLFAISENAKAWGNIEKYFKELMNNVQKAILPFAILLNTIRDIQDTMADVKAGADIEIDWGAQEGRPGEAVTYHKGTGKKPPEKPMALPAQEGDYSTQTEKQKSASKKAADDARKIAEARSQLKLEIGLIQQKAKLGESMFALNSKAVVFGEKSVEQDKMVLALTSDIYDIRAAAAKERTKEDAQIDLINAKEKEQITARVKKFGEENGIRIQQREREHMLALQNIEDEGIVKRDQLSVQTMGEHDLLDLESKRFELGSDAYDLAKLDIDAANRLVQMRLNYLEQSKQINKEYEQSAHSAKDLEIYEAKITELRLTQGAAINYTLGLDEKRKEVLAQQIAIQDKMFKFELERQKNREIGNIEYQLKIDRDRLALESRRYSLSENQYQVEVLRLDNASRMVEAEKRYSDMQKEAYAEMERQGSGQKAREQYEEKIRTINEVKDAELKAIEEINAARTKNQQADIERQRDFSAGWEYASKKYAEDAANAFNRGSAMFSSVMGNMNSAISTFVDTGKFKFQDFAVAIIKDLIRIQIQARATMLLRALVGSFSAVPTTSVNYDAGIGTGIRTAATGGTIDGPTIVGENGPELFIPAQRGTVIPNTIAPSMAGSGQPQNVFNGPYIANMSAIDTQSAAQFLSKNKTAVWGAYQSANRTVPISR